MRAKVWGPEEEKMIVIYCPGCKEQHWLNIDHTKLHYWTDPATKQEMSKPAPCWSFNGDFALPTFSPSLLVKSGKYAAPERYAKLTDPEEIKFSDEHSAICHSFINSGRIQFLSDCTHSLANQTVDLPELRPRKIPKQPNDEGTA